MDYKKIEEALAGITEEKLDSMSLDQRLEIQKITQELKERKLHYPIADFTLQDHQKEIEDAIAKRNADGTPYYKFIVMIGGN